MLEYQETTLDNGLILLVHEDKTTPLVAMNILYNVGARDESPSKTGFAHLFEHLMFGGSANIPSYDEPLQQAGGENNAFTTNDITNFYLTIPSQNLETGFWLESDRMMALDFSERSLENQRNVVVEEFNQRYLNQPYGDMYHLIRSLAYKVHPYQWPTIGKDISHIQQANITDVKDFFYTYYAPNNAILVLSGNVTMKEVKELAEKWFGPIPKRKVPIRRLPVEPIQIESRHLEVSRDVPFHSLVKTYHTCSRIDEMYPATDLLSDLLSGGNSSRFFLKLVKERKLFSELDAYVTGDIDPGLFVIKGKVMDGIDITIADKAIEEELQLLSTENISERELNKVKNKYESNFIISLTSTLNKAMSLAFYRLLGDTSLVNKEIDKYSRVSSKDISALSGKLFSKENCSTLFYLSNNKS
jgi:zinc protease